MFSRAHSQGCGLGGDGGGDCVIWERDDVVWFSISVDRGFAHDGDECDSSGGNDITSMLEEDKDGVENYVGVVAGGG